MGPIGSFPEGLQKKKEFDYLANKKELTLNESFFFFISSAVFIFDGDCQASFLKNKRKPRIGAIVADFYMNFAKKLRTLLFFLFFWRWTKRQLPQNVFRLLFGQVGLLLSVLFLCSKNLIKNSHNSLELYLVKFYSLS